MVKGPLESLFEPLFLERVVGLERGVSCFLIDVVFGRICNFLWVFEGSVNVSGSIILKAGAGKSDAC